MAVIEDQGMVSSTQGGSQPVVTTVLGNLVPSPGFSVGTAHKLYIGLKTKHTYKSYQIFFQDERLPLSYSTFIAYSCV